MAVIHLPYHIWVKDYHWTTKKVRVQSPILNLQRAGSPPVFRPKEGNNKNEPRVASTKEDLSDGICETEYLAEAHGIFIPNEPPHRHIPLWVTFQQTSCAIDGETSFMDLRSNVSRSASISRICWVPSYRSQDGKLYTVLGGTRVTQLGKKRTRNTMVCVQKEALPQRASFTWISAEELSCLDPLDNLEKRRLFDMHQNIILTNHKPLSEIQRIVFTLAKSPGSLDNGRRAFTSLLAQDPEVYLSDGSDGEDLLEVEDWYDEDNSEQEVVYPVRRSTRRDVVSDPCVSAAVPLTLISQL